MSYNYNILTLPGYEGRIFMGRAPGYGADTSEHLREIKALGISKVYCLQEEEELLYISNGGENIAKRRESLSELGIELVHSPVKDFGVPSKEQASELADSVLSDVRSGKNILIHCMGGLGRTGTMSACVLVRHGLSPAAAVAMVRDIRPGTLETDAQVNFVSEFLA
jgi:protein-tyrosine phosphatase